MSNRQLLANTLESAVQNDLEREKLQQYRDKIQQASGQQQKLGELKQEAAAVALDAVNMDIVGVQKRNIISFYGDIKYIVLCYPELLEPQR